MAKTSINQALLKDDLYHAVNDEWLKTATIPADKPATGGFYALHDTIEKTLMDDYHAFLEHPETAPAELRQFIAYYRKANDYATRNKAGFSVAEASFTKIHDLTTFAKWQQQLPDLIADSAAVPFGFSVEPDMKNTKQNALYVDVPNLILPDKTYYDGDNPSAKALLQVYAAMMTKLFKLAGFSDEFTETTIKQALEFDASLAPHQRDSTQLADYTKLYNKQALTDFAKVSANVDFKQVIAKLFPTTPEFVIVTQPEFFAAFDQIVNEQTFANMKAWMLVKEVLGAAPYVSDEARVISGEFSRALSGTKQAMSPQKAAFYLATGVYDQAVGLDYAHRYFGAKAKADVTEMVKEMIAVYEERLTHNDWLSEATAKQAVVKLKHLAIKVGYPDKLPELFKRYVVDSDASLYENTSRFVKLTRQDNFARLTKPVDRSRWSMPAHMVNAYYDPNQNVIVFPAAILQAPFYSLKQSSAANFGGIGAVIAHEISHAFDNNGAKFDEFGNLKNWWTADDLKHFEHLAQAMIDQFDGLKTEAGTVNGKLVVSENIADAGGLSCALAAAKKHADFDAQTFFINWAKIWCMKSSRERQKLLLKIDVHAPHELRANVQPKNLDDFYTAFDVHEGDGMYLAPEKRISIW